MPKFFIVMRYVVDLISAALLIPKARRLYLYIPHNLFMPKFFIVMRYVVDPLCQNFS